MSKVWLVTGCSSGFGRLLTEQLIEMGERVVTTARNPKTLDKYQESALVQALDVTDRLSINKAIDAAIQRFGKIDVLVNNAGFGIFGSIEDVPIDEYRRQFETNFFGAVQVIQAILPHMRSNASGTIVNISSIAGVSSFSATGVYCASKFALEAISESLHHELRPSGIRTILIEPGAFKTDFVGHNYTTYPPAAPEYKETVQSTLDWFDQLDAEGDPSKAVRAIIETVSLDNPPMRLLLGEDAWHSAQAKLEWLKSDFTNQESITRSMNFDHK
jgi:NAD(P)-dependent dehydrogenase (short-subunit alcohol dehydrogenase family)